MKAKAHTSTLAKFVVGIGASAGGLEAIRPLLAQLRPAGTTAYVIAQHMSPQHRSMLVEILAKECPITVVEASDGAPLQADIVYISPPNRDVLVHDGKVLLHELDRDVGPKPSIDTLLISIAESFAEKGAGIILSGTGSDGSHGCRAIRAAGGLTIAQTPKTAKYDGMPNAAIRSDAVDIILEPAEIGRNLPDILQRAQGDQILLEEHGGDESSAYDALLREIYQATKVDFSEYKKATLLRQTNRRLTSLRLSSFADYLQYIHEDPDELQRLKKSFLISVTSFFRDGDAFDSLKVILEQMLQKRISNRRVRIWVPGCATGEEAYSFAILLHEILGNRVEGYSINIFGTDIDLVATEIARKGVYSAAALEALDPGLLDKYFVKEGRNYKVSKRIRDMCVFARHDLVSDPPFLRMNLISCRNLLIYLQNSLQDKLINNFHYSLASQGILFLGKSESISRARSGLFHALDERNKIFERRDGVKTRAIIGAFDPLIVKELAAESRRPPLELKKEAVNRCLLKAYAPPSVLINSDYQPLHFFGDTSAMLTIPEGMADFNLLALVPEEMRTELRALLYRAQNSSHEGPIEHPITLQLDGKRTALKVVVRPIRTEDNQESLLLVSFEPPRVLLAADTDEAAGDHNTRARIEALESDLSSTREHLQAVIEELEASNEELQSLNEELQAATEELQSSNEELSTTNEELQASNEELTTLNDELQAKSEELGLLNSTLNNIQSSINMGLVVLDEDLRILRYTPRAVRVFGITPDDIGRRIQQISTRMRIDNFADVLDQVVRNREAATLEVSNEQETYIINASPYLVADNCIAGVILTFSDITELSRTRQQRAAAESKFRLIADSLHEVVWMSSRDFSELLYISPAFRHYMGLAEHIRIGQVATYLDAIHPDDRATFEQAVQQDTWDVKYRLQTKTGSTLWLQDRGGRFYDEANQCEILIGSAIDITQATAFAHQLQYSEEKFRTVFESSNVGIVLSDEGGEILEANAFFCGWLGLDSDTVRGRSLSDFVHSDDLGKDAGLLQQLLAGQIGSYKTEKRYQGLNDELRYGLIDVSQARMAEAQAEEARTVVISVVQDITEQVRSRQLIDRQANYDALTLLPNRNLLQDRLDELIKHAKRSGEIVFVLFIDLDGFKEINDSFGHDIGDIVLKEVASRLSASVRESDTVARFGGDEFVVLVSDSNDIKAVDQVLHKILTRVHQPILVGEQSFIISASIGVSNAPHDSVDAVTLIRYSDTAMYIAKRDGGNAFTFFSPELNEQAQCRHDLKRDMQAAITDHQLELYFQPIIDPHGETVSHAEALLRWQHPVRGMIPPGTFIPMAEETALIEEIDLWVFAQVADYLSRHTDYAGKISFNMTARTLMSTSFGQLVEQHQGMLERMVIEITERVFHKYPESLSSVLRQLRRQGCLISLDDFGTGYSNLGRIKSLPLDVIKLDKTFTDTVSSSHSKYPIIEAVFNIAEAIGSRVIVEGVESEEQKQYFEQFDKVLIQGYYYSKPLPENRFLKFLDQMA
ncbi:two-component system, chemotaxis family, CheB/CheR fusion protein [Marinobacterium sediminicola]|uniref:protein-glutamate O-methyltransferase n=2 Tax=Marinobacterium sediminicola TaxID=518898 RepID=A0ABY1S2S3_9GAMM|nr:two-component system, chemotaxis family, CheB/CheR fusion protein [Marinobacterium sediminicola]